MTQSSSAAGSLMWAAIDILPMVIGESDRRKKMGWDLEEFDQQLTALDVGRSIPELEEEARGVVRDQIAGQLELISGQLKESQSSIRTGEEK